MIDLARKFKGKKLLLLGTNSGTCDMVRYAKSQGAYVIVTDNSPPQKSPAKLIADEAWQISTDDVDTLEKLSIKNKINGIFAGVSEFNLEKALTLTERLGLPFYCSREQWETCSNKRSFKQLCRDNDVPVSREYIIDDNNKEQDLKKIHYPVIVKPVDSSSGIGIGICASEDELLMSYTKAVALSKTHQAVVEEFIKGDEFSAGYTITDSQFSLSYVLDRYLDPEYGESIPLPQANILPSVYIDKYLAELNNRVIKMFQSIGLTNGFIFVQGRINNEGFRFFEANYRLPASLFYRFASKINGINSMEMMVNNALTGKMDGCDLTLDNPRYSKYCCVLSLISKGGLVGKIIGLEEIRKKPGLIAVDNKYNVGDFVEKSGTLRQIQSRLYLMEDTLPELRNSIKLIQDTVKVLDDKGNNMLMPPFDTDRI
jgi:carbamoylphosphate synthase large subunit